MSPAISHRLRRRPGESDAEYLAWLSQEIGRLEALVYLLRQDLRNVHEVARRAQMRSPAEPHP